MKPFLRLVCLAMTGCSYDWSVSKTDLGADVAIPDAALDVADVALGEPVTVSFQNGVANYAGTADTYLAENDPTHNFGTSPILRVGNDSSGKEFNTVIRWDLSTIPTASALVAIDIDFAAVTPAAYDFAVYDGKCPWVEGEATWNLCTATRPWQVDGARGNDYDRGHKLAVVAASQGGDRVHITNGYDSFTNLIERWIADPSTNQGLIIFGGTSTTVLDLQSCNATDPAQRPRLTIRYRPPLSPE